MAHIEMDREMKMALNDALQKLDDDVTEIEEINKEMDDYLYSIEKRIAKLRRSER